MLNLLFAFLFSLVAASPPLPPVKQDPNPIVSTCVVDGTIVNVHADLMLSAVDVYSDADELTPLASFAFDGREVDPAKVAELLPQLPPGGPVPTLTTKWVDALGVEHTVVTPIASSTPQGLKAATELHERLVKIQQGAHPPRPVP